MNNRIIKTLTGFIDLDKIVNISEPHFEDWMGKGGYYVSFEIHCQLLEKPISYSRRLYSPHDAVVDGEPKVLLTDGNYARPTPENYDRIVALVELRQEVEQLVAQWRGE